MSAAATPAPASAPVNLRGPALWWRLLVIGALWGSAFPLLRHVAALMPPFAIATSRGVFAALAVLAFLWATGQLRGWGGVPWRAALVLGTCNGWIPNVLTALAMGRIGAAPASLIHAATPLFVALLTILVLREERPGPRGAAGLALGFCGIAVILGPAAIEGGASFTGGLLIMVSGLSYAAGTVYARATRAGGVATAAAPLVLGQQVVAAIVAGGLSLSFDPLSAYDQAAATWGVLLVMAVFTSALPLTMFLSLLARARVNDASMVGYLQPLFAASLGALLLGEVPEARVLAGGAVVLAGVWVATGRR